LIKDFQKIRGREDNIMEKITLTNDLTKNAQKLKLPIIPEAKPVITVHWSASTYDADERKFYHLCVMKGGEAVIGVDIRKNVPTTKSGYAPHTGRNNGNNIGVSIISCAGITENGTAKGDWGKYAPTEEQIRGLILVLATLCRFYGISHLPPFLISHGEVTKLRGIRQNGKWDLNTLPGHPWAELHDGTYAAMNYIRGQVGKTLAAKTTTPKTATESESLVLYRHLYDFADDMPDKDREIEFLATLNELRSLIAL